MRMRSIGRLAILTICCVAAFDRPTFASNWPRFRGGNGTGIAADKDVPVEWNDSSGVLWRTALPGTGNSSPIVWGQHIFLQAATADGRERLLLCLNAADGKVLWSRSVPASPAKINPMNSLASSTPATDGVRVYVMFWDGQDILLHAYNIDGTLIWKRNLGRFTSQHGAGTSPIVYEGRVFLANDQDGKAALVALDAKTGKTIWQVERRPFRACYSTPFVLQRPGGGSEIVACSTTAISGYNPETGAQNWTWSWTFTTKRPLRTTSSAIFSPGMIFASSGDGSGDRHMVALNLQTNGGDTKASLAWQNKRDFPYVPTMLVRGDHVYSVNDVGVAGCHVAKTGAEVWTERLGGSMSASPILVDGKVYAVSEQGDVYVFEAAPTFKLLAKNPTGEPVKATPAVADSRLFIRGQNHLFCIGKSAAR
jgi:outer membrane protein assembly factor BamB